MRIINIGLVGLGTVGCSVVKILAEKKDYLEEKTGLKFNLKKIADKDIISERPVKVDQKRLTTKVEEILNDPEIDIVIELIGGIEPAHSFIKKALSNKKYVITANKALLAQYGEDLFKLADQKGVEIGFEASVGGGIPIIKSLREGFIANRIKSLFGIINGTANYILTRMSKENKDFSEALEEAKKAGYAESEPFLDLEGTDSAHKLTILATLAFGARIKLAEVFVEGISKISLQDIQYAKEFGYVIKLLSIAKRFEKEIEVRVHPTMIPLNSLLASVNEEFNAIYVTGDSVGPTMFYGKGAGGEPAASAVLSDLINLAQRIKSGVCRNVPFLSFKEERQIRKMEEVISPYYIRFSAVDQTGVLANISRILGENNISISSVMQKGRKEGDIVPIVMMTHKAKEQNMQKALKAINKLAVIKAESMLIRVEGEER